MKQALEALNYLQGLVDTERGPKAAAALRQALSEAQLSVNENSHAIDQAEKKKPYGYLKLSNGKFYVEVVGVPDLNSNPDYLPLHTTPQPQEFVCSTGLCHFKNARQREWVGLTDEEMDELVHRFARYEFAREIEAKLKEKNQ
jgi:hypothetical protein